MPRLSAKYMTKEVKEAIVKGHRQGRKQDDLASQFKVSQSGISHLLKRNEERRTVENKKLPGKARATTDRVDRAIVNASKAHPRKPATQIRQEINEQFDLNLSVTTIKRRLSDVGRFGRRPVKKPYISKKNRVKRLQFAKQHLNWTVKHWEKVLWSDEKKFLMFRSDGNCYVRRPQNTRFDPKYQIPTVKHGGGKINVWGCFSRDGLGPIHEIKGIMFKEDYKAILKDVMLPHAKQEMARGWIFQQDNDPKHTANLVKDFMKSKKIRLLEWPAQSPDLNPIENLWDYVDRQIGDRKPSNAAELMSLIKQAWESISIDYLIKLVDSMPKRCKAVIDANGYATRY